MRLRKDECLILRSDDPDGVSTNGFQWPEKGPVEAPDWSPNHGCGNGLHGFLGGCGTASLHRNLKGTFRVIKVRRDDVVDLEDKVKFRCGTVVLCTTDPYEAARFLIDSGYSPENMHFGTATAGENGTATVGDFGYATAGYKGVATAGYKGVATAGYMGKAAADDFGYATAGYMGRAMAGDHGHATAGCKGHATAGENGHATTGLNGCATAGLDGTLQISRHDGRRFRVVTGYVGENGIEPNVAYRLNADGDFVKA